MNTVDSVPKNVLRWIMDDIEDDIDIESTVFSTRTYYPDYPEYFKPVNNIIWSKNLIGFEYTDKAKALYYMLKL